MSEAHNTPTTARAASRRELLTIGLFATLAGVAGKAFATPRPTSTATNEAHVWTDGEARLLHTFRKASPVEKAAILRFLERALAGDDMHAAGVEFLTTCGWTEVEARARITTILSAHPQGHGT